MFRIVRMASGVLLWLMALATALQLSAASQTQWESLDNEGGDVLVISGNVFVYHTTNRTPAPGVNTIIKLAFKTSLGDSVLLYANGGVTRSHFLLVSISADGHLKVSMAAEGVISPTNDVPQPFASPHISDHAMKSESPETAEGSGYLTDDEDTYVEDELLMLSEGRSSDRDHLAEMVVTDGRWHTLLISLEEAVQVFVQLDNLNTSLPIIFNFENNTRHLTDFYFGQIPVVDYDGILMLEPGAGCCSGQPTGGSPAPLCTVPAPECMDPCHLTDLQALSPFVGCLERVTVNGLDLVASEAEASTQFIWTGGPTNEGVDKDTLLEDDCTEVLPVLRLSTPYSHVALPSTPATRDFSLELSFRQRQAGDGVLASGLLKNDSQQFKWQLYCEENQIYFKTKLPGLELSHTIHEAGHWNDVRLWTSGETIYSSVNGINNNLRGSFKFLDEVTLGDKSKGLVACLRAVKLSDRILDMRTLVDRGAGVVMDRCQSDTPTPWCQRGEARLHGERLECDCAAGHDGSTCQFDQYPSSCAAYRHRGFTQPGPYALLLAGLPVTVQCRFEPDYTVTEFHHNVPQQYEIGETTEQSRTVFNVSYGGRAAERQLAKWASDNTCEQKLAFDCSSGLSSREIEHTKIQSPAGTFVNIFAPDTIGVCIGNVDSLCEPPTEDCKGNTISGKLQPGAVLVHGGELLPVTGLLLQSAPHNAHPHLSLSTLTCTEPVAPPSPVSLRGPNSFIQVAASANSSASFSFRTRHERALLLRAVPAHGRQEVFLIMRDGSVLETLIRSRAAVSSDLLHFNYLLNTGAWQYFLVSFGQDQIKLIVNGHAHFITTPGFDPGNSGDNIDIFLGGSPRTNASCIIPGLQGCISEVSVNSEPAKLTLTGHYELGCEEACVTQPCGNGGDCQDLLAGDYDCVCQHPFTGPTCDNDASLSAMSFLNERSELYRSEANNPENSNWNPITKDTSFSFKTRESKARLLFAYDHLQNFLNVHMSKPNEIVVIWNSGNTLKHVLISTGNRELNTSREVRVNVARTPTATQVTVIVDQLEYKETLDGAGQLIEVYQQKPFNGGLLFDMLPHYPQPVTAPAAFLSVHLGGASLSRQSEALPGLVGCIDSFVVNGENVPLQDAQKWETNGEVLHGCPSSCVVEAACAHGGVCLDRIRADQNHYRCDCTNTGYGGGDCHQEVSFNFLGSDYIGLHYAEPTLDLELSFALKETSSARTELLFFWHNEDLQAGVAVLRSERLMVWGGPHEAVRQFVLLPEQLRAHLKQFGRHRVQLMVDHFNLSLEFDGRLVPLTAEGTVDSPSLAEDALLIGGYDQHIRVGETNITGFTGCISNVKLVSSSGQIFSPLEIYQRSLHDGDMPELLRATNITGTKHCSSPVSPVLIGVSRTAGPQGGIGDWMLPSLQVNSDAGLKHQNAVPSDQPYNVLIVCSSLAAIFLLLAIIAAAIWCWNRGRRRVEGHQTRDQPPTKGGRSYRKVMLEEEGRSYRKSTSPVHSPSESGLLGPHYPQLPFFAPSSPTESALSDHSRTHETLLMNQPEGRDVSERIEMRTIDDDPLHWEQTESNEDHNLSWSSQNHKANSRSPTNQEIPDDIYLFTPESYRIQDENIKSMKVAELDEDAQVILSDPKRLMITDVQGVTASQEGRHLSNAAHCFPNEMTLDDNQFHQESIEGRLFTQHLVDCDSQNSGYELGNRFQEYVPRENPSDQIPLMNSEPSPQLLTSALQASIRIVSLEPKGQQLHSSVSLLSDDMLTRQPSQCSATFFNDDGANGHPLQLIASHTDEGQLHAPSAPSSTASAVEDDLSGLGNLSFEDDDMFQAEEILLVQPTSLVHKAHIISRTQSDAPNY